MEVENVKIELLKSHPQNPRVGDVKAIAESIKANGWWGTVVVQKTTNHVLAGNHRVVAAESLDIKEVPVYWVDVDDDQALKILLADNKTNDMATYDLGVLSDLLKDLSKDDLLLGSGYDSNDLELLTMDGDAGINLDLLEEEFPGDEQDLWRTVSYRLPAKTFDVWNGWWRTLNGSDDAEKARLFLDSLTS
jgi:ParB-like chromosome segregation protein Spo0J